MCQKQAEISWFLTGGTLNNNTLTEEVREA